MFSAGLAGHHQKINASLAVALVQTFLSSSDLPPVFRSSPFAKVTSGTEEGRTLPTLSKSLNTSEPLPPVVVEALENTRWPGRCQTIQDRSERRQKVTWHLDGAHTVESLVLCGEWFTTEAFKKDRSVTGSPWTWFQADRGCFDHMTGPANES